jgi:hypothetical protein
MNNYDTYKSLLNSLLYKSPESIEPKSYLDIFLDLLKLNDKSSYELFKLHYRDLKKFNYNVYNNMIFIILSYLIENDISIYKNIIDDYYLFTNIDKAYHIPPIIAAYNNNNNDVIQYIKNKHNNDYDYILNCPDNPKIHNKSLNDIIKENEL